MKKINLENNIQLVCIKATGFPEGILEAHKQIHNYCNEPERVFYGISRPNKDGIIEYFAGTEPLEAFKDASKMDLSIYVLKKGVYLCSEVEDYHKNLRKIGDIFNEFITRPDIAADGECIEVYDHTSTVRCMIRLQETSV